MLAVSASRGSGAGGQEAVVVVLRNTGTTTCTLDGYPSAHFASSDGTALPAQVVDVGPPPSLVTLGPGSPATTTVWTTSPGVPSPSYCQPVIATGVSVTLPPGAAAVTAALSITVCSAHGTIEVPALVAGTGEIAF